MRVAQLSAPPMAMVTTFGLLLLMYSLINTNFEAPPNVTPTVIDPVVMPERVLETVFPDAPTRPEPPTQAPPPISEPVTNTKVTGVTSIDMGLPPLNDTGVKLQDYSGGDYMPIIKVAPQYPRIALTRGLEGYVVVSFTVTASGRTRNVVVLDAVTKDGKVTSVFDRAAIAAAEQFKYQPRVQDGVPIEVHGVKNRFVFELD